MYSIPSRFHTLLPKDYITTEDGLFLAVVLHGTTTSPVHCSLRYVHHANQAPVKLDTGTAFQYLKTHYPDFVSYSELLDCESIRVPPDAINSVFRPEETTGRIRTSHNRDRIKDTALHLVDFLTVEQIPDSQLGITGSLMLDFHKPDSDIDIVIYESGSFHRVRDIVMKEIDCGHFAALDDASWENTYNRRNCSLELDEYMKHEKRKYNKFMFRETKVDISYVPTVAGAPTAFPTRKIGPDIIRARVIDDSGSFSYPAVYLTDHDSIREIRCFTATYTGQAFRGEFIEASGMVEADADGRHYMVIGTSREAPGEYIRVPGL